MKRISLVVCCFLVVAVVKATAPFEDLRQSIKDAAHPLSSSPLSLPLPTDPINSQVVPLDEIQSDFIADAIALDPAAFEIGAPGVFPSNPGHDFDDFPQDPDNRPSQIHIDGVNENEYKLSQLEQNNAAGAEGASANAEASASAKFEKSDHDDDDDDDHDSESNACNEDKEKPYVRPMTTLPVDWKLFPRSFSAEGYFDYDTAGMQMPIVLHYDADTNSLVVNHTSTYHYFPGSLATGLANQSAIAINTALSSPVPVWSSHRQSYFGGVTEWNNYYKAGLRTDGRIRKTDRGYKIKRAFGNVRDHHKPVTQRATVIHDYIVCDHPNLNGLPKRMIFELVFPCSVQGFDWTFIRYKIGKPPASVFKAPFFFFGNSTTAPYGNIPALPAYENAVFNRNCQAVAVPPVP